MKTKDASRFLAVALSFSVLAVYGCGGGGGGGGGTTPTGTTGTTISNASQAGSAGASGTQSASVGANAGQTLSGIAAGGVGGKAPNYHSPLAGKDARFNKVHAAEARAMKVPVAKKAAFLKKAKAAAAGSKAPVTITPLTMPCDSGGSFTIGGTYDDQTFAYDITMTFSNCREMDEQLNGTIAVSGKFSSTGDETFKMTMGDGDGIIETAVDFRVEEFANNYTVLFAKYIADMTVTGSGTADTTGNNYTFTFTANGKEEYSDFIETYTMTFLNLQFASSQTYNNNNTPTNYADDTWSGTDTINGGFSEAWTELGTNYSASFTFTSFVIAWEETPTYVGWSVDGTVTTDFTPDSACAIEGIFVIDTTVQIREDMNGKFTQGEIVINTNTTIKFDDPDGSGKITVTVTGQTPVSYNSEAELEALCQIEEFEQDTTSQTTFGNTTSISGTVPNGKTLVANLSWNPYGVASSVIMDLHVNYYAKDTPTGTDKGTWYIDWHNRDVANVLPDDNPATTESEYNLEYYYIGQGANEANDFDRLVINGLPAGYYVFSVNSYSLGTATSVAATTTIDIGGNLFTFPTCTFTTADFEGTNPAAWCRVCDIHVATNGDVHIMEPNAVLQPWHDGAFGMFAPKKARGLK